jgi:histidyl-tRNA synthetase
MNKASIPQGTRDFDALTVRKRQYLLQTIREVFECYGFAPLETPAMEQLDTLMGKYGEEGDKLIFKILNNGLHDPKNEAKARAGFAKVMEGKSSNDLTERALRYDLTIPFARYVAMHHAQLSFPFRRYQMQPVWRADRPQKGRYREFTQCDADIVGSTALRNEVELALIYHEVFTRLGIGNYTLSINNRKILSALAQQCGGAQQMTAITIAIDKLDKIGLDKVKEELIQRGITAAQMTTIVSYLQIEGDNTQKLAALNALLGDLNDARQGIAELEQVLAMTLEQQPGAAITIDFTLARGLNYYTGIIFEAKAPDTVKMGSIGGGGRYDDLTGLFGVPGIPGVGISFGIDRIYDVLEELQLFPADLYTGAKVLFFNLGEAESREAFAQLQRLRAKGISGELYHETAKLDKQFKYAEKKHIPYAVLIGTRELETGMAVVKQLSNGVQHSMPFDQLSDFLTN